MKNEKVAFILKENIVQVLFVALAVISAGVILVVSAEKNFSHHWGNWLEAYTTGVLIFIALSIWYNEQKEEWHKSLPKRLDVTFLVGEKAIMTCENSSLVNESDVRLWGQQLGMQMGGNLPLKLQRVDALSIGKVKRSSSTVYLYDLKIFLKSAPKNYGLEEIEYDPNKKLHWSYNENGKLTEEFYEIDFIVKSKSDQDIITENE